MLSTVAFLALAASSAMASPTYEVLNKRQQTSDQIYVIFSQQDYETIPGPRGGSTTEHEAGFSIFTGSGAQIYTATSVANHAICEFGGNNITVSGACLGPDFVLQLSCAANDAGEPGSCAAWANVGGTLLDCEEAGGSEYNDFITAGTSSTCVVSFAQANDCASDMDLTFTNEFFEDVSPPCDPCPSCN